MLPSSTTDALGRARRGCVVRARAAIGAARASCRGLIFSCLTCDTLFGAGPPDAGLIPAGPACAATRRAGQRLVLASLAVGAG